MPPIRPTTSPGRTGVAAQAVAASSAGRAMVLSEQAELDPAFKSSPAKSWANTGWAADARFKGC
jgi:hypothetical protein